MYTLSALEFYFTVINAKQNNYGRVNISGEEKKISATTEQLRKI